MSDANLGCMHPDLFSTRLLPAEWIWLATSNASVSLFRPLFNVFPLFSFLFLSLLLLLFFFFPLFFLFSFSSLGLKWKRPAWSKSRLWDLHGAGPFLGYIWYINVRIGIIYVTTYALNQKIVLTDQSHRVQTKKCENDWPIGCINYLLVNVSIQYCRLRKCVVTHR